MSKYQMQFEVSLRVAKTISADDLEDALKKAREIAKGCPVRMKLVKIGAGVEYLWNNDTVVSGVTDA